MERELVRVLVRVEVENKGKKESEELLWCVAPGLVDKLIHLKVIGRDNRFTSQHSSSLCHFYSLPL